MTAIPDRMPGDPAANGPEGSQEPAGLAALALLLRDRERRALLETEGPARSAISAEAEEVRARLDDAAAGALARGHSLAVISASAMPSADARARFEAVGRLAATCARLAEVEEVLMDEARALGGELPFGRNTQFQRAMSQARTQMHLAVRGAVFRGVAPRAILEVTRAAGLVLEEGDLTRAFDRHVEH